MKTILCGAVAAIALVGMAAPAAAQTHERDYAGIPFVGTLTNPGPLGTLGAEVSIGLFHIGTRYTADASSSGDTEQAQHRINVAFHLRGTVNRDCSFYAGNNSAARNIDFGVIGVRTGDNENVNSAFEMVGPADANIETLTAGCNTNNQVEINKDDIRGLVNNNPGGYDTNQFQANIPYQVKASWTGVALNAQTTGTPQSLTVATNANAGVKTQGAWRSNMQIDIHAPAVTSHGLVAGTYTGKTTITLRAI
jgi:hypothetical protein